MKYPRDKTSRGRAIDRDVRTRRGVLSDRTEAQASGMGDGTGFASSPVRESGACRLIHAGRGTLLTRETGEA